MDILAFNWAEEGNNKLTLVLNKEKTEHEGRITESFWEGNVLGCQFGAATFESGFGINRRGRFVFLLTKWSYDCYGPSRDLYHTDFLESHMSPHEFAEHMAQSTEYDILSYNLILGDMASNSIVYVSKPDEDEPNVEIQPVPFGVHTLSTAEGLDSTEHPRDIHLREQFSQMIVDLGNDEPPPFELIAERYIHDIEQVDVVRNMVDSKTTATVVFVVQRSEGGKIKVI